MSNIRKLSFRKYTHIQFILFFNFLLPGTPISHNGIPLFPYAYVHISYVLYCIVEVM